MLLHVTRETKMGLFDDMLTRGRAAALAEVSKLEGTSLSNVNFELADAVLTGVASEVPSKVDVAWCVAVLTERPDLLGASSEFGDDIGDALRGAVVDLIEEAIADDIEELARSIGLLGASASPGH
jgi:hypothetical protein